MTQKWYAGDKEIDLFDFLHEKGADAFRIRLWVSEDGSSGLKYATEIAHKAQKSGLKPYLVIFLSDRWTDLTKQPSHHTFMGSIIGALNGIFQMIQISKLVGDRCVFLDQTGKPCQQLKP